MFQTPNRQYSQTQGRWMTPDPAGLAAVNPTNPQTWNRYAYVRNNPESRIDPSGMVDIIPGQLYAMTGGSSYNSWADSFISMMMSSGASVMCGPMCEPGNPGGVGQPGTDNLIYGWKTPLYGTTCTGTFTMVACSPLHLIDPGGWGAVGTVPSDSNLGLLGGVFYPGQNGPAQAAANAAKNFMKNVNQNDPAPIEEPWPSHEPLDWESDFMSPETQALKALIDGFADGLDEAMGLFMVAPNIIGCAGYGGLPCDNGSPTSF